MELMLQPLLHAKLKTLQKVAADWTMKDNDQREMLKTDVDSLKLPIGLKDSGGSSGMTGWKETVRCNNAVSIMWAKGSMDGERTSG